MKGHVFPEAEVESKNRPWMSIAASSRVWMTHRYWEFLEHNILPVLPPYFQNLPLPILVTKIMF